jgi:hypothetical protein
MTAAQLFMFRYGLNRGEVQGTVAD